MQKNSSLLKHLDFMILDLLSLTISFLLSYFLKLKDGISVFNRLYLSVYFLMIICDVIYIVLFNPYKNILRRGKLAEVQCSLLFVVFNAVCVAVGLYVFKQGGLYSRTQLAFTYIFYFLLSIFLRIIRKNRLIKAKRDNKINVLLITDPENIESVIYNIENSEFAEYLIKCVFLTREDKNQNISYPLYTKNDDFYTVAVENNVLEVFAYCEPNYICKEQVQKLMEEGIDFHLSIDKIFGFEPDNEELSNIAMYRTLNINSFSFSAKQIVYAPFKRMLDILFSLFACLLLFPIYLAVKLSYLADGDKGPVIYSHVRVGKNGREFNLYKFRSMVFNADDVLLELLKDEKNKKEWEENHKLDDDQE